MGPAPAPSPSPDVDVDVDVEVMRTRVRTHLIEIKRNTEEANLHRAQIGEILWIVSNAPGAVQRLGYETVGDWMKQEFGLDRRMAEQLRRNYEVFFANRSLSPELQARVQRCDWTKLREIAPHVTDSNVEELLNMAEMLSRNELIARLRPEPAAIGKNDDVDGTQPNGLSESMLAATKSLQVNDTASVKKFISKIESKLPVLLIAVDRATGKIIHGANALKLVKQNRETRPTVERGVQLVGRSGNRKYSPGVELVPGGGASCAS